MDGVRLVDALAALRAHEIRYILVGGMAAVLGGAPVNTYDLDVLYAVDDDNIERVMRFFSEVGSIFRMQPDRRLAPNRSHVAAAGHLNLLTRFGPMDFLGFIGRDLRYEDLLAHSYELDAGSGVSVRVLNLETIIRVKEGLPTPKDNAMLPVLREALRQLKERDQRS